jgi:hypothetical protein
MNTPNLTPHEAAVLAAAYDPHEAAQIESEAAQRAAERAGEAALASSREALCRFGGSVFRRHALTCTEGTFRCERCGASITAKLSRT